MSNPYSAPNADLSELALSGETYQPKFFSLQGRIGRLRYLAYSFIALTLMYLLMAVLAVMSTMSKASTFAGESIMGVVLLMLINIPLILVGFVMMRRRLNDLNRSGWAALLMFVPILNFFFALYLMFGSGSAGSNRYGPKPVKNSVLVVIVGLLLPATFVFGILAAIAVPAYKDYTIRAKATSQSSKP